MDFLIRQLEALGDEVAAALDDLADEVAGRQLQPHAHARRHRGGGDSDSDDGNQRDDESASAASVDTDTLGNSSSAVITTDEEGSATDEPFDPPLRMGGGGAPLGYSLPPPVPTPMSAVPPKPAVVSGGGATVKRRPLLATRIPAPPVSDPRLSQDQAPRPAEPQRARSPPPTTVPEPLRPAPPVAANVDTAVPVASDATRRPSDAQPKQVDPVVPGAAQVAPTKLETTVPIVEATAALPAMPPLALRLQRPPQPQQQHLHHHLSPTAVTTTVAPPTPAPVDAMPQRPQQVAVPVSRNTSDFDLCDRDGRPIGSPTVEGEYLVL